MSTGDKLLSKSQNVRYCGQTNNNNNNNKEVCKASKNVHFSFNYDVISR